MKIRSTVAVLFLLALCSAVAVLGQDKSKPAAPPAGAGGAEMEAMMKAATPGEPQKRLARLAGDWTFTNQMWMDPSQPPMESTGTMHGVVLMGGRYVEHTWKGNMMGMAFEGRGTDGYDNVGKEYVASWVDNMGTGIMHSTGTCDDAGKVCTYNAEMWDPMSGKKITSKSVITWLDDNTFTNEMYGPGPDGKEAKMMVITAKRKK
ncbi:MAG TPA: DUF1579 domain-containing protein [Thermoanaerobaculia bacterium]|jgi:hypothetical protein|nr:DUF1579 domain-containing protein [Thermoanaerobaculia bacterium]